MTSLADRDLVEQLQAGDLKALGGLYDRHRQLVYRTALAITGDPESASDILQDVFLRFYRFADRFDTSRPVEPWLYRMTSNMAYTWMKRQNRLKRTLWEMAEWFIREKRISPSQQVEFNEDWQRVQRALNSITLEKRMVVVMYYLNDLSLQEISEVLEIPVGTAKSRLHYGREALRKRLKLHEELSSKVGYEPT